MALGLGSVSQEFAPGGKAWCREHYSHLRVGEKKGPTDFVVLGTIGTFFLWILLEFVTHFAAQYKTVKPAARTGTEAGVELLPTSSPSAASTTTTAQRNEHRPDEQNNIEISFTWCVEAPVLPRARASRLALAIIIYPSILAFFILRIRGALNAPYVPEACKEVIGLEGPDWVAIGILNCVPFACASVALLRALIDCMLVRRGKHLGSVLGSKDGGLLWWPPYAPLIYVVSVVGVSCFLLVECIRIPIWKAMGDSDAGVGTEWFSESVRRDNGNGDRGEEQLGLVQNVDGGEAGQREGGEEPPAYEEAVGRDEGRAERKEDV